MTFNNLFVSHKYVFIISYIDYSVLVSSFYGCSNIYNRLYEKFIANFVGALRSFICFHITSATIYIYLQCYTGNNSNYFIVCKKYINRCGLICDLFIYYHFLRYVYVVQTVHKTGICVLYSCYRDVPCMYMYIELYFNFPIFHAVLSISINMYITTNYNCNNINAYRTLVYTRFTD